MEILIIPLFLLLMGLTIHSPRREPGKLKKSGGGGLTVDVTFNENQTFPMILDTGADATIITQKMANALKVQVIGKIPFTVANNQKVEWAIGLVDSVEVGGAKVDNVLVGIAPERTTGLLGQTFLEKCDYKVEGDLLKCSRKWTPEG